jgi:hypothetical protein
MYILFNISNVWVSEWLLFKANAAIFAPLHYLIFTTRNIENMIDLWRRLTLNFMYEISASVEHKDGVTENRYVLYLKT